MQTVGETGSRAGRRTAAGPKYYTADRENTLVRWAGGRRRGNSA